MSVLDDLQKFRDAAEEIYHTSAGDFIHLVLGHIEKFTVSLKKIHENITSQSCEDITSDQVRLLLEYQRELHDWINSITEIRSWILEDPTSQLFENRFKELLHEYPERLCFEIPDEFWRSQPEDSLTTRFGKQYRNAVFSLKNMGIGVRNFAARAFNKKEVGQIKPERMFYQHNFVNYFFRNPALKSYHKEIQNLIAKTADCLYRLHETSEKMYWSIFFKENDADTEKADSKSKSCPETEEFIKEINAVFSIPDEIKQSLDESDTSFSKELDTITEYYMNKWQIAGTFVLPDRQFDEKKIKKISDKSRSGLAKSNKLWDIHLHGEEEDWHKDIELTILQLESDIACRDTIEDIHGGIAEKLFPVLDKAVFSITESGEKFKNSDMLSVIELSQSIRSENDNLVKNLRDNILPHIMETVLSINIIRLHERYINRLRTVCKNIDEQYTIFKERDTRNVPPDSKISQVALKELVLKDIFQPLAEKHEVLGHNLRSRIEQVMRAISEIDQIVEYNMNTALVLCEEEQNEESVDKAFTLVFEGLERTQTQLNEIKSGFQKVSDIAADSLNDLNGRMRDGIHEMANNDKVFELKIRLAHAKTREEIRNKIKASFDFLKKLMHSSIPKIIELFHKFKNSYVRIRRISGLAPISTIMDAKLAEYLSESQTKLIQLPYVYQRLFSLEPLTDRHFFSSREENMTVLKNAFSQWQVGKSISVSLTGERGSGKTSLLYFAKSDIFNGIPVITVDLKHTIYTEENLLRLLKESFGVPDANTMEELETALINNNDRRVCIFENLHNLYLRTVYGFDAIERFMLFVQRTENSIFWIVTCALYGWRYLDKVIHVSGCLGRTVELGMESREQVEDTIIKRHRVSGYLLRFDAPEEIIKSRKYRKLSSEEERQLFLNNRFFDQLAGLASGNIRVAILFWLMAIKEMTKDTMIVSSEIEFDHAFVYQLAPEELFSLAALIQHERINAEMHSTIFSQDIRDSELILNRMLRNGYLQKNGEQYSIHPFLYRPVVKALQSKNILQ